MLAWGPIRVARVILGPSRSRSLPQICLIHLQHAATTKHLTGNHHIIEYKDFSYPNPKDYDLELWSSKPLCKSKDKISLFDVFRDYLKPGFALLPLETKIAAELPETNLPRYRIGELDTKKLYKTKNKKGKGRGSKEFHYRTDVETGHFAHSLYKSYHFLSKVGNTTRVEIHVHYPMKKKKKNSLPSPGINTLQKREEILEEHKKHFSEAIHNALHLWPETILKAMPEGTCISISPVANKDNVCWVMDFSGREMTNVFQKNRKIHQQRYDNCEGLPDKDTRRNVKHDLREIRLQVRSEIENKEKKEQAEEKRILDVKKKNSDQDQTDAQPQSALENMALKKIGEFQMKSSSSKQAHLGKPSFTSLVTDISLDDIANSINSPKLTQLKALIHDKIKKKGTMGLFEQCDFEMLPQPEMMKVILISILQITQRADELNYELEHGSFKIQRENNMILERTGQLYKEHPSARQLQEEIKRRLEVDLNKVKRKTKDKIEKESRKLMRQRYKLFDYLGPSERKIISNIEGGRPLILLNTVKKAKPGWNWQARGASKS